MEILTVDTWKDFLEIVIKNKYRGWAYRGQQEACWTLEPTITRYFRIFSINRAVWHIQEERIIRTFRRRAHLHVERVPLEDNTFEWLALMQHYGAPTRLLDFSWSPYVAAFFALEAAQGDAAVWGVSPRQIMDYDNKTVNSRQSIPRNDRGPWVLGNFEELYLPGCEEVLALGEPEAMNQRMVTQLGTFLVPGMLDRPIEEIADKISSGAGIIKIIIKNVARREAMYELYRANITNASLFPGLGGLAKSMAFELERPAEFDPITLDGYDI